MTKAEIILEVGEARYWEASKRLVQMACAPGYGSNQSTRADPEPLPHEIEHLIWDSSLSPRQQIGLFFELFDDLPSYGMLMYAMHRCKDWDSEERTEWWREFRKRLVGAFHAPLTYSLWCDFFEDPVTVGDAWRGVTIGDDVGVLVRVLPSSGPVPWSMKRLHLWRSVEVPALRPAAFDGIVGAAFDVYGKVDKPEARVLARLLQRSVQDHRFSRLMAQLASEPHVAADDGV